MHCLYLISRICEHTFRGPYLKLKVSGRLHYISPSNLRSLLLLSLLQLRDLCPCASEQGLIRPSPPRSRRDQSDRYFFNMVNPRNLDTTAITPASIMTLVRIRPIRDLIGCSKRGFSVKLRHNSHKLTSSKSFASRAARP